MKPTIERTVDLIGETEWLVYWEDSDGSHCEAFRSKQEALRVAFHVENEAGLVPAQGMLF